MNQSITIDRPKKEAINQKTGTTSTDSQWHQIAINIVKRFQSSCYLELRRIQCESCGGILVLRGQVSSYHLKQVAQEEVRAFEQMARIVNKLEVVYSRDKLAVPPFDGPCL